MKFHCHPAQPPLAWLPAQHLQLLHPHACALLSCLLSRSTLPVSGYTVARSIVPASRYTLQLSIGPAARATQPVFTVAKPTLPAGRSILLCLQPQVLD